MPGQTLITSPVGTFTSRALLASRSNSCFDRQSGRKKKMGWPGVIDDEHDQSPARRQESRISY
jgi:hypothetical protein